MATTGMQADMPTGMQSAAAPTASRAVSRSVVSRIASKWQVTVPVEVRELFGMQEGDFFEWEFDAETQRLFVVPKRAQLLTPQIRERMGGK